MASFFKDESGNIAVTFALGISVLLMGVGVAIDTLSVTKTDMRLQSVADAAALAGAYAAENKTGNRKDLVREAILANLGPNFPADIADTAIVNFDDTTQQVSVQLPYRQNTFFGSVTKVDNVNVAPISTVSYLALEPTPISIAFALDVSGSMGDATSDGQVKLQVLKDATRSLFSEIRDNAKRPALLDQAMRTSVATYNTDLVTSEPFDWGSDHITSSLNELSADGGTDSRPALQYVYDKLIEDRQTRLIQKPSTKMDTLKEFAIFMTDGDNNELIADPESAELCRQMRDEGIEVYSVAFAAPDKGQALLLDCASWDEDRGMMPDARRKKSKCRSQKGICGKSADAPGQLKKNLTREELLLKKETYFFDAENGADFRSSFAAIGRDISRSNIVIKS